MNLKTKKIFLETPEAAHLLGVTLITVKRMAARGDLTGIVIGRRHRILLSSVFAFLAKQVGEEMALQILREGGLLEDGEPQKGRGREKDGPKGESYGTTQGYTE